ncbi:WecB/TagA/CpsF family glycosyltransferase [Halobacteriovorax sp. HLS]|uniref:WecB/TagA/CpsF family glycosyltransferase n=1 Tax=Halobacteriovorax sp. HLS TaxID=2234000 RepID=UPI000FDC0333|nr:WecB/TagA/CpsF family glycosyltransferase [Halobacteriovorax sp. HLS]
MVAVKFANIEFKALKKSSLLNDEKGLKLVVTANSEIIIKANETPKLQEIMNNNFTTFDGKIPHVLAKLDYKNEEIEKISGSDFIYDCCRTARKNGERIFLLGCREDVNRMAVNNIREQYGIQVEGFSPVLADYPFPELHNKQILNRIKLFRPHYLFVGFGAPKQEFWMDAHKEYLEELGVKVVVGSGGTFDFVAGAVKRAPVFIQNIGLEGVWRFLVEPKWFRVKRVLVSFKIFYYWLQKK